MNHLYTLLSEFSKHYKFYIKYIFIYILCCALKFYLYFIVYIIFYKNIFFYCHTKFVLVNGVVWKICNVDIGGMYRYT